jgi:uncharacterized protein
MIQRDKLLKNYSGSCPIFPLPDFVMFPASGHEFTIFEPRYIEMIDYILKRERLLIISLLKPGWQDNYEGSPSIYDIGTLGYVSKVEKLKDGKYFIVLIGLDKVLINETEKSHNFRIGATTSLGEITTAPDEVEMSEILLNRFFDLVESKIDESIIQYLEEPDNSLQMLVNIISMAMPIPAEEKQKLLELPEISLRYEVLLHFIDAEIKLNNDVIDFIPILPFDDLMN